MNCKITRLRKKQNPSFTVVGPWFFDKVTDATKAVKGWTSLICPVILRTFVLCCSYKLYSLNSTIQTLFSDQFNLLHTNFSHLNRLRCNKWVYFPQIKLSYLSTKETERIIDSLKWKNSHGYDEMSLKILKVRVLLCIALTLETYIIFTSHHWFWHLFKKDRIIWVLRCSVVFLSLLRIYLIVWNNLNHL
jgi:hypothetical protein